MTYLIAFIVWLAVVIYLLAWLHKMRKPCSEAEWAQDTIIAEKTYRRDGMRYRKGAGIVEAVQYTEYGKLVKGMCNSIECYQANSEPHVHTIHNNQMVLLEVGDWIMPEPDGKHFYPCKPDIFEATYEKV